MRKYIAFLDILGFKDLIENNSHESVLSVYKKAFENSYKNSFGFFKANPNLDEPDAILNSMIISDSIIIWSEEMNNNSLFKLIIIVQSLVNSSLMEGIPLRGAIDVGELSELMLDEIDIYNTRKSPVILGNGLTKAYTLESSQQWSGCVISDECIESLPKEDETNISLKNLIDYGFVLNYKVPFKSGKIESRYVVNWPLITSEKMFSELVFRDSFKRHNKSVDFWDVELKIKNTIEFYNYAWSLTYAP